MTYLASQAATLTTRPWPLGQLFRTIGFHQDELKGFKELNVRLRRYPAVGKGVQEEGDKF